VSTEQPNGGHKKPPIPTPAKKVPAFNIERRGDRLYQVQSLHKWFAISSLLLFVFTIAMVLQDYSREWKRYQREFRQLSIQKTRDDRRLAASMVDGTKYNQLREQIAQANSGQQENRQRINELEEQLASLNSRFIGVDLNYKSTKATYDAERYAYEEALDHYEEAVAAKASNADSLKATADRLKAKTDETETQMNGYFTEREEVSTQIQQTNEELKKFRGQAEALDKERLALRAEFDRLTRQLNTLNPGAMVTTLINAPLLDFMSPSLQIKQILLPNLFYDQPFKQISRADRCTTCHLGIDQQSWESASQPFKAHPNMELFLAASSAHPMDKFGCTSCHGGLDRATDFQTAGHTPRDEMQKEEWIRKYGWHEEHYLETPMYSMPNVEAGCYKCHNASPEVPRAAKLDNGRDLIRIYGCFGCHKMPGYEGIRKVGPDLGPISGKLTKDWVRKWLANPKDFKSEARMPKFWFNSNNSGVINGIDFDKRNIAEINAITEYLWSESKPKPLPGGGVSGNVARGKELVETKGCFGCHAVGPIEELENRTQTRRMHGYNLANQGSKVQPNWIFNWVKDPRQVWADSKMPSLRLSDSEATDIAAYLSSLKNAEFDTRAAPQSDPAALDAVTLELLRAGSTEAKARQDLAAMSVEQKNLYAGKGLVSKYGCYGCHTVPGFEKAQNIGTELTEAGSKLKSQLDFGFLNVEHSRASWYEQKLHDPRIFDVGRIKRPEELLKMPNFGFNDKQVQNIVMVLTSMVKDPVPLEMKDRTPPEVVEGRQLVAEKNCRGCHIIEGLGGDIRGHLRGVEQQAQLPPNLNTQGHKTQPEWLYPFLRDPSTVRLRPWLNAVMPTFHLTEHEAGVIGKYFSTLDKVDFPFISTEIQTTPERLRAGADLFTKLECAKCHPTGSSVPAGRDPSELAPDLLLAQRRLRPDWVIRWLTDPQKVAPNTRMPTFWGIDDKTGQRKSQFPDILGGDPNAQMQAVRDHLFSLGGGRVRVSSAND
jgi:cbb3-type cytochrome oxidase cytochrome c subunit